MANSMTSSYTKTYSTFSGADIVPTFDGKVIGELQALTYSVTREKAPVYTMGSADPRSFSRGKRGIAGSLVFQVFDRDVFHQIVKTHQYVTAAANVRDVKTGELSIVSMDEWDALQGDRGFVETQAIYSDQIPPFDITVTMRNEYGQSSSFAILGVEILNEGMGMSIDDITTEKACTFVARGLTPMTPGGN